MRLNQLHSGCNSRVKYLKVCPEHGELKPNEIVSAYEYAKDQYVEIKGEEIARIRPQSDKSVHIDGFVDPSKIDPIYLAGKTYYLLPDGLAGNKPYALLYRGMVDAGVVAIGQIVLSGREQLVLLRPAEDTIIMSVLNIAKRVKPLEEFSKEIEEQDMTRAELALTKTLIEASTLSDFDYAAYQDEYTETLTKLIQKKIDGQEIVQARDHEEPRIINLMEALKASVAKVQAGGGGKMAPSVREEKGAKAKSAKKKMAPSTGRKKAADGKQKKSG